MATQAAAAVADGVYRLGTSLVDFYLLVDDEGVTVVDAGFPRHWGQLDPALRAAGRRPEDVRAVVLTHAHVDHTGVAERLRAERGARVHVHGGDALGGVRRFPPLFLYWRPASWPLLVQGLRDGMLGTSRIGGFQLFDDGQTLPVPGRPHVVHVPGHTPGSVALHLPDRGVLLTGDALVTLDPYTGARGPRVMLDGVNDDTEQARRSLARLAPLGADVLLPGHGEPWHGSPAEAVERALSS
ncbi:MAG: MBL fold metallo-hydrolase [Mycobacterium leprae]